MADDTRLLDASEHAQPCAWFARCANPAVCTQPHPVLGNVPICQRCHDKLTRIEEDRS